MYTILFYNYTTWHSTAEHSYKRNSSTQRSCGFRTQRFIPPPLSSSCLGAHPSSPVETDQFSSTVRGSNTRLSLYIVRTRTRLVCIYISNVRFFFVSRSTYGLDRLCYFRRPLPTTDIWSSQDICTVVYTCGNR